jgi:hypothetical protein
MKHSPEKELLVVVILGFLGLIFLWLLLPVPVSLFNYLPLFLISYLLAIFLPGYTFLSFIKPDMSFRVRLEMGILLSLVLLFVISFLFIFLEIPSAFTYAVSVLMILSIIMAFSTYLGEKMGKKGQKKVVATPPRKPPEPLVDETYNPEKDIETAVEAQDEGEKTILKRPPRRRIILTPPEGEVEVIIPNHVTPQPEAGKTQEDKISTPKKNLVKVTSSEKPTVKLPWIERQKELDQKKMNSSKENKF